MKTTMQRNMPLRICLLSIFVLTRTYVNGGLTGIQDELEKFLGELDEYRSVPSDVVFLLESSGYVEASGFDHMKSLTATIVRHFFSVSENQTRVAVVSYSSEAVTHADYIRNGRGENLCALLKKIGDVGHQGKSRYTHLALERAQDILRGARPESEKIVVLFTNGLDMRGSKSFTRADELKAKGVAIFVIGFEDVSQQIRQMATSDHHSLIIGEPDEFSEISELLAQDSPLTTSGRSEDFCGSVCGKNAQCHCESKTGVFKCMCGVGYFNNPRNSFECRRQTSSSLQTPETDEDVSSLKTTYVTSLEDGVVTAPSTVIKLSALPSQPSSKTNSECAKINYNALDEVDSSLPLLGRLIKSLPRDKRLPKIMELLNNVYNSVEKQ